MSRFRSGMPIGLAAVFFLLPPRCEAQEAVRPTIGDNGPNEFGMSREEWRLRVEDAKRRVREDARQRREHPELYAPIRQDPERTASERVLNDETLQKGDIVATSNGLFLFRGDVDKPRAADDFVPLSPK